MARAASIDATCYLPNGTAAYDNTGVMVRKVILMDNNLSKSSRCLALHPVQHQDEAQHVLQIELYRYMSKRRAL